MNSRQNSFGLSGALSLATVCMTFTLPAFAQDAAPAAAPDASLDASLSGSAEATTDAPLGETSASAEATAPEPSVEPAEGSQELTPTAPPAEPAAAEPVAETPAADDEKKGDKKDSEASNSWGVKQLSIVQTPWSAYPSNYVRGLTYGSLWRTFHGQQWPFMPSDSDELNMQIGIGGYIWNDLSNAHINADEALYDQGISDQNRWTSQTRGVLRMTPTLNVGKGWFVQGNAELVVQGDMQADPSTGGVLATTDDLWIRAGKWNLFDITVGRFQGWEIANHYGMGLDWGTLERQGAWIVTSSIKPTDGYGLDYFWDRQNFQMGGYALHVYPTKWLRGELMGHIGSGNGNASNPYQFDIRPSAIFDIGFLKIKGGYEYGKATPQDKNIKNRDTKNGWGVAAQVVLAPYVEFGASMARGYQDVLDKDGLAEVEASNTAQTIGGFINVSPGWEPLVIGGGAFLKSWENFRLNTSPEAEEGETYYNDQWLLYGAVQYTLWKQLYLKFVMSHASNKGSSLKYGEYINNSLSGRLRVEYLF